MATATAARAHRLWYQGTRSTTICAPIRDRTRAAMSGVDGQASSRPRATSCSSSSGTGHLHLGSKACQRPREARLDGALRDAERRSSLLAAQLEEVPARDHLAVLLAQRVDQRQQPAPVL